MIKEKIQSELQNLGVNLERTKRNEWVEILSKNLTDESTDEDISNYVKGFEVIIKAQASAEDSAKSLKAELEKARNNKPTEPNSEQPKPEQVEIKDETPQWAKDLQAEIQGLKADKLQGDLTNRFLNNPELKGLPESLTKRFIPKSEDEFDTNLEELKALALETKLGNYGQDTPPSSTRKDINQEASDQEVQDVFNNLRIQ